MGLFGKTHDKPPKDLVNEWSLKIRKEMRVIDRQIRDIQREEDTFESMEDDDEMEEAAEAEVDKILFEITAGALGKAPSKVTDALPEMEPPAAAAASEDESEEDIEEMHSRLAALRS
uniref:Charged multivesicular body protein 3 n=1 Tax=Salmo salar TaxID=8030 RepID=B5XBI9_SALSA|nr:Charged multivesicular body protein 3 [Salmo salar]